jgi:hypothetical protein
MDFILFGGLIIASFYFVITRTAQEVRPLRNLDRWPE